MGSWGEISGLIPRRGAVGLIRWGTLRVVDVASGSFIEGPGLITADLLALAHDAIYTPFLHSCNMDRQWCVYTKTGLVVT